jgi:nitrous oxidase accessory protein NosD
MFFSHGVSRWFVFLFLVVLCVRSEAASTAYYVNDTSVSADAWCTATGNDANSGTSPSSPKATVQAILGTYDLEPGDTVYIDTGHFLQSTNFEIGSNDCGSASGYVSIIGSPNGTTIDRGNTNNTAYGLSLCNADYIQVQNLTITSGCYGIFIDGDNCVLSNVTVRNARDVGIRIAFVQSNRLEKVTVRDCGTDGIYLLATSNHLFRNVEVRGCGDQGVYGDHAQYITFENSLIWSNANMGVCYIWDSLSNRISSSTIAFNGLRQIHASGGWTSLELANSIVRASGTSNYCVFIYRDYKGMGAARYVGDYNCFHAENGALVGGYGAFDMSGYLNYATLANWQSYSSQDAHSLAGDPLFVDSARDFHLRSSVPNGTYVKALAGWTNFPGENSPCIDAGDPARPWSAEPLPNGGRLNLGAYGNTPEASRSRADKYYVNDGSTAGDIWCSAAGSDANAGYSPDLPKATVQDVLADYDLEAGDTIYVDTGHYVLTNNITVESMDGGTSNLYMSIRGSPAGTVFDGESTNGGPGVVLSHVRGVQLRDLTISNAYYGVRVVGDYSSADCRDFALSNIVIRSGRDYGVMIEDASYGRLDALDISGVYHGISIYHSRGNRIAHCAIHNNRGDGIRIRYFSGDNSIVNCTVALNRGAQLYTSDCDTAVGVSNNILVASGTGSACIARLHTSTQLCNPHGCWYVDGAGFYRGDYNDFCALNGANVGEYNSDGHYPTLADWQAHSTQDVHSIGIDPLFVDSAAGDLHLRSAAASGTYVKATGQWTQFPRQNSPGIDAGDPAAGFENEPERNGGRLNLGAYGNTPQASRSAYRIYYVNDTSTVGDAWCTAPGDDANPGYFPSQPKATMQSVVTTYDLAPGDKVFVDTGVYRETNSCHVRTNDSGTAAQRVCFIGNTGSVVIAITNHTFGFYLEGAEYVDVSGFTISNAHTGVYCFYAWDCGIRDITVRGATVGIKMEYGGYHQVKGCDVRDGGEGFMIYESVHNWIMNSVVWSNSDDGLWIMHGSKPTHVYCCTIGYNGYRQIDLAHNTTALDMWNCIVVASGDGNACIWQYDEGYGPATYTGDYNLLYAVNNAYIGGYWRFRGYPYPSETYYNPLSSWQAHSTQDAHSISSDPLFVSNAGDLHLRSSATNGTFVVALNSWTNFPGQNSPAIDAGHATDSCTLEPQWNGGIADAGAYGNTPFASRSADTDGDRLSDSIEKYRYGSNPDDADSDDDGMGDRFEMLAGTCATNRESVFESDCVIPEGGANNQFVLRWPSAEGRTYRIQSSIGTQIHFTSLATGIPATTPLNSYTVTVTGVMREMFRVGVE